MPVSCLYGAICLPWWGYVACTFAMVQLMFLGVTLYLHRDQSHGGLRLHPALRHLFRFWLWFCSGTVTREWVAVHRRHHAFADRSGDPHSPVIFGLRRVLLQGYELYVAAARDPKILANYGRGTPDDWLERNLYSRFPKVGISLFVVLQLILFGVPAIVMLAVQLVAQPLFAGGVINGFGHRVGYRSFELPTAATNIVPWGILVGGEELHNNHHAFPSSPRFAVQRWEIDIGWLFICVFRALGLARIDSLAPTPNIVRDRAAIDADSVQALFTNRMHVLRDYRRRVIRPVFRAVTMHEDSVGPAHRSAQLLIRHPQLLDEWTRQQVRELLGRYEVLRTVIEFRDHLQQIWDEGSASHARALEQLRHLCIQAENSGILALREFALRLRTYAPVPGSTDALKAEFRR
ncbi:MAG TPA: fatty acid desaturase [Steroidobacteraceae bacterium]|jgi:stearoyl-CoA desaturase (delta-9 desaturase)|nr:fatty acid desaturase [Steroidobacteraceae bacterium]